MKKLIILLTLALPATLMAQKKGQIPKRYNLLVGTYTNGDSKGIYAFRFYTETGKTAYLSQIEGIDNPSYLTPSKNEKFIYSVNEIGGDRKGSVTALSFEPVNGKMEIINTQPLPGSGPCYISVDEDQKNVFVANYGSGSLCVLPVNKDGSLGAVKQTIQDQGSSIDKSRQAGPHVHTAVLSPDEKYLLFTDLGTDKINVYRYKPNQEMPLIPGEPAELLVSGGSGPRHLDFTPDKKHMYVLSEMGGIIYGYDYDGPKSKQIEAMSILPAAYKGAIGGADIHVSPDGKFLYASNRGDLNEIVVFAINPDNGRLTFVERKPSMGKTPRNFVIDPSGSYLLVANQNTDNVFVYRINKQTGQLTLTPNVIKVGNPSCLKFVQAD